MTMPVALIRYPDAVAKVLEALALGVGMTSAADYAGLAPRTVKYWLDKGRSALEAAEENDAPVPEEAEPYVDFAREVGRLRTLLVSRNLNVIQTAAMRGRPIYLRGGVPMTDEQGNVIYEVGDWKAAAWYLERVHRDEYGVHTSVEMSGHVDGTLTVRDGDAEVALDVRANPNRIDAIHEALAESGLLPYPEAIEAQATE